MNTNSIKIGSIISINKVLIVKTNKIDNAIIDIKYIQGFLPRIL